MMCDDIWLRADFGDRISIFRVYQPSGGGDSWHILQDGSYLGEFVKHSTGYFAYLNRHNLDAADISELFNLAVPDYPASELTIRPR